MHSVKSAVPQNVTTKIVSKGAPGGPSKIKRTDTRDKTNCRLGLRTPFKQVESLISTFVIDTPQFDKAFTNTYQV